MPGFIKSTPSQIQINRMYNNACKILDIKTGEPVTPETVNTQWRKLVKERHPDRTGEVKDPRYSFQALREAKDFLIGYLEELDNDNA